LPAEVSEATRAQRRCGNRGPATEKFFLNADNVTISLNLTGQTLLLDWFFIGGQAAISVNHRP